MTHRGWFTEDFARDRLEVVFGKTNVYANVDILEAKSKKFGEIDVLVIFGNRAIVLQAKSKRLTLEARKGNDQQIKDDFKKAIQDSYDQAYSCACALNNPNLKLVSDKGNEIIISDSIKKIYLICVVADHYPALSFQVGKFLKYTTNDKVRAPLVPDVFALDAMTEMLDTPLHFLSYVRLKAKFGHKLIVSRELIALSYHLKRNLWLSDEHDMVMLEDDISADLDLAMAVRREGIPGKRTPDGILTRHKTSTLGRIVQEIEAKPNPATIDFGLMLLTLNEEAIVDTSHAIDKIAALAKTDLKGHNVTLGFGSDSGLTIHCNFDPIELAAPRLKQHCEARKYSQKAGTWFGLVVRPEDASVRFGLELDYPWKRNERAEELTKDLPKAQPMAKLQAWIRTKKKFGRNEPSPAAVA